MFNITPVVRGGVVNYYCAAILLLSPTNQKPTNLKVLYHINGMAEINNVFKL